MPIRIITLPESAVRALNTYLTDGGALERVPLRANAYRCRESLWKKYKVAQRERSNERFLIGLDLSASLRKHST